MISKAADRLDCIRATLHTAETALINAFRHALPGFAILDLEGRIQSCNAVLASLLGYSTEEIGQQQFADLIHPEDAEAWTHAIEVLMRSETRAARVELRLNGGNGPLSRICNSLSLIMSDEGLPFRIVVIAEDRTRQRLAEKALVQAEALVSLGRLSASIAHEMNNPLESVTNLLFLISHSDNLEHVRRYSKMAEQELERVSKISTQTLRYYRPQSAPAPVQLEEVLDSALILFEGRLRRDQMRVTKHYQPGTPSLVTYSGELRQVFVNLIGNSLDAMKERGHLRICVKPARCWKRLIDGVRVTISDCGTGIPKHMLKKVFEPFVTTKETTGTGLGLWISKDIVERHGGTLHVRSAVSGPGQGTTMSVFLPSMRAIPNAHAA